MRQVTRAAVVAAIVGLTATVVAAPASGDSTPGCVSAEEYNGVIDAPKTNSKSGVEAYINQKGTPGLTDQVNIFTGEYYNPRVYMIRNYAGCTGDMVVIYNKRHPRHPWLFMDYVEH